MLVVFLIFCKILFKHQILWNLCSVDLITFTLKLPTQTLLSVALKLPVFASSGENVKHSAKREHPRVASLGKIMLSVFGRYDEKCQKLSKTSTPQSLQKYMFNPNIYPCKYLNNLNNKTITKPSMWTVNRNIALKFKLEDTQVNYHKTRIVNF